MESLYIPQAVSVNINLDPCDLDDQYELKIKQKIEDKYGDTCYHNGFIKRSSIEILKISNGYRIGSHLDGIISFRVEFKADFCVPRKDKIIRAQVKTSNIFGLMAKAYPIDIIVPKQLQQLTNNNHELLGSVKVGDYINVKILDHKTENSKLVVIGVIVDIALDKLNSMELPMDGLWSKLYTPNISISALSPLPQPSPALGENSALIELKNKITPYTSWNEKEHRPARKGEKGVDIWANKIKNMINGYELIGSSKKYHASVVKTDPTGKNGIRPPISRAYFKLWEVLSDLNLLSVYKDKPITIANLAEGPGGFIQCLIDFRDRQNGTETSPWTQDTYHGITLKQVGNNSTLDWDKDYAKKYFDTLKNLNYNLNLGYGVEGDGNLLKLSNIDSFASQIGVNIPFSNPDDDLIISGKCELVTADGGIELEDDLAYSVQELANGKLFFSEIITALSVQKQDGTFVMKVYDMYYDLTLKLIALLSIYYKKLTLIKPMTSRPANSEKYLVCQQFAGITVGQLQTLRQVLKSWTEIESNPNYTKNPKVVIDIMTMSINPDSELIEQIKQFNNYNTGLQMERINEGLVLAQDKDANRIDYQKQLALKWCEKYQFKTI